MTTCANPIPFETLVDLWAGALAPDVAASLDEHLFACDNCARASEQLGALVTAMRELIPPVLSRAQRDALVAKGLRIKEIDCTADRDAEAFFAPDLDLMVHVLHGDLRDAERVDVEVRDPAGRTFTQFVDVPFDAARGEVLIACQRHYREFEVMTSNRPVFRVVARTRGAERHVGDFLVEHVWPD